MKKTKLRFSYKEYTIGGVLSSALAVFSLLALGYSILLSFRARGEGSMQVGAYGLLALVLSLFGSFFFWHIYQWYYYCYADIIYTCRALKKYT